MLLFLFLFLNDLYVLIPAIIAQIFNPIADFVIPIGIPTKEAKAEMETHPVIVEPIFQSKFLTYVIFNHIFKVIIFFQLNQKILIFQSNLLL